ncbi:RNA polymerase sigma factor [candidate division KSB1 bacterium]|nr:MAG: RNA polymerase sigma factor [candidate division KSB1 bacterium]
MENIYKNEKDLVKQVLQNDQQAIRFFIRSYKKLVEHIIWRIITRPVEREDLFQDIFVKIFTSLPSFRFDSKLSTWIGRISYNTCLNYVQKNKPFLSEDLDKENNKNAFYERKILHDEEFILKEQAQLVKNEIMKMNYAYRTILTLFHLENLSYKEIGEIMGLPEGTVKSNLYRARKKLYAVLKHKYAGEMTWL